MKSESIVTSMFTVRQPSSLRYFACGCACMCVLCVKSKDHFYPNYKVILLLVLLFVITHMAGFWREIVWISMCDGERQTYSVVKWHCQVVRISYVYPSMFFICKLIEADALHLDCTVGCKDLSGVWITDANVVSYFACQHNLHRKKLCTYTLGPNIIIIKLLFVSTGCSTKQTAVEINVAPDSHEKVGNDLVKHTVAQPHNISIPYS